jgi:hypothetical protein
MAKFNREDREKKRERLNERVLDTQSTKDITKRFAGTRTLADIRTAGFKSGLATHGGKDSVKGSKRFNKAYKLGEADNYEPPRATARKKR